MKKVLTTLAALALAIVAALLNLNPASGNGSVAAAFAAGRSDEILVDQGRVVKVLRDDNDGSRHQRFIVEVKPGLTVLIAHNIDLAPRVANLREGDQVRFKGEYEFNAKGGVVHWTHHDPKGWHEEGWIEHEGERYE